MGIIIRIINKLKDLKCFIIIIILFLIIIIIILQIII